MVAALGLQLHYKPFSQNHLNFFEFLSLAIIFTLIVSLTIAEFSVKKETPSQWIISIVFLSLFFLYFLLLIGLMIIAVKTKID